MGRWLKGSRQITGEKKGAFLLPKNTWNAVAITNIKQVRRKPPDAYIRLSINARITNDVCIKTASYPGGIDLDQSRKRFSNYFTAIVVKTRGGLNTGADFVYLTLVSV
jgi:hypothetical protein